MKPEDHWVYARRGKEMLKIDIIDIKRAHFNPGPKEPTYVELPLGRRRPGYCAQLRFNLYGSRRSNPCIFHHPSKEILTVVHGDDFTSLGTDEALDWMKQVLEKVYELKHGGRISPEPGDQHEVRILNRIVCWDEGGLRMEI